MFRLDRYREQNSSPGAVAKQTLLYIVSIDMSVSEGDFLCLQLPLCLLSVANYETLKQRRPWAWSPSSAFFFLLTNLEYEIEHFTSL